MGMYGERLGRGVTREAARKYETSVTERARRERWQASGCARVVSRKYGTVVVPHGSNFAALLNAAEVWGCDWTISIHALREEGDSKNRDKISIFKQIIQHSARI